MDLYVKEAPGIYRPASAKDIFKRRRQPLGKEIKNSKDAQYEIGLRLQGLEKEVFGCLWLSSSLRVIKWEVLFKGTLASNTIYLRELVKTAIKHNAAAAILAHNHPSGNTQPSQADIDLTAEVKKALRLINVDVVDHLIIADDVLSMAETGAFHEI